MTKVITKRANGTVKVSTTDFGETRTQQQFKDQCDVNLIVAKYKQTGEFLHISRKQGVYADVSNVKDYQSALDAVHKAQYAFDSLPATTRKFFQNDPQQLLAFMQDKNNYDQAVKMGLIEPKKQITQIQNNEQTQTNDKNQNTKTKTQTKTQTAQSQTED